VDLVEGINESAMLLINIGVTQLHGFDPVGV
jgi:hypothetical protein